MDRISRIIDAYIKAGPCAPEIESGFAEWLVDPRCAAEKNDVLAELWEGFPAGENAESRAALQKIKVRLGHPASDFAPARKPRRLVLRRIAAVLLALAVLGGAGIALYLGTRPSVAFDNPILTIAAADSVKHEVLPDSSQVWLNHNTSVTYGETGDGGRYAELTGEACFGVAPKDCSRFEVRTSKVKIMVRGTEFNVSEYPHDNFTVVMLYNGSIELAAGRRSFIMEPGSMLTYVHDTGEITVGEIPGCHIDWRSDPLNFVHEDIYTVLKRVSNFYGLDIDVPEQGLHHVPVTIRFDGTEEIDDVLFLLGKLSGCFTCQRQDGRITVVPK